MKLSGIFNSKQLRTGSIGSMLIKLMETGLNLGISILLARFLGLEGYGVYVLVYSTVMLLSVPMTFGLPLLLTRNIPKYEVQSNLGAIKGLLIKSNQFIGLLYLGIAIVAISYYFLFRTSYSDVVLQTAFWGLLLLMVSGFNSIRGAALKGMRFIILGQLPDALFRTLFMFTALLIYHFTIAPLTPQSAMAIHLAAMLVAYSFGYYFLHTRLLRSLKMIAPVYYTREWLSHSFQFSLNMGINSIKTRLSTYILAIFSGPAAVALFEVAFKGANLVSFALTALNTAIAPHISKEYEAKNFRRLQQILTKASRIIFFISVPVTILFIFFGDYVIQLLFGIAYEESYWPLVILCVGQLVNAFAGSVGLLLNMTGKQRFVLKVNVINTAVNIGLAIILVKFYDVVGAAIAYSILLVVQNFIFVWYTKRNLKINTTIL